MSEQRATLSRTRRGHRFGVENYLLYLDEAHSRPSWRESAVVWLQGVVNLLLEYEDSSLTR